MARGLAASKPQQLVSIGEQCVLTMRAINEIQSPFSATNAPSLKNRMIVGLAGNASVFWVRFGWRPGLKSGENRVKINAHRPGNKTLATH
jgi:hypothetical protein